MSAADVVHDLLLVFLGVERTSAQPLYAAAGNTALCLVVCAEFALVSHNLLVLAVLCCYDNDMFGVLCCSCCVQRSALGDLSECQFQPVIRQCSLQGSNELCGSSGSPSAGSASPKITETWIISEFCNAGVAHFAHV
jgi:hypothetical protein